MSSGENGALKGPKAIIEQVDEAAAHADEARAESGSTDREPKSHDERTPGGFQDTTIGFFEGVGRCAWAYADAHPHATLYGIIGFVLAVLILVIGLWDTIVIAVFVAVGTVIGQMVDGDNAAVNFVRRLLDGRR